MGWKGDPGGVRKHAAGVVLFRYDHDRMNPILNARIVEEGETGMEESGAKEPRIVVATVIKREGRYLVALRPPEKRHGGMWEFPGGKLDPCESLFDAACREVREELGIEVDRIGEILQIVRDPGSEFAIHFVDTQASGIPVPLEHTELRWCTPKDLRTIRLAPADAHFAATLS